MTEGNETKTDTLDFFVCEKCKLAFPITPEAGRQITCPACDVVMDKSNFSAKTTKLWTKKKGPAVQKTSEHIQLPRPNFLPYYRRVARFRQAVFDAYQRQEGITLAQAIGMQIAFCINFDERDLLRFLGKDCDDNTNSDFLFDLLANFKIRRIEPTAGGYPRSDKPVLELDAAMLRFCPNGYTHFLRDALTLRSHEYSVQWDHASAYQERWQRFWKAKRAIQGKAGCKEIWETLHRRNPEPPNEDWWKRVALEQGMYENKYKEFGIA